MTYLHGCIKGTTSIVFVIQHQKVVPLMLAISFMHLHIQSVTYSMRGLGLETNTVLYIQLVTENTRGSSITECPCVGLRYQTNQRMSLGTLCADYTSGQ